MKAFKNDEIALHTHTDSTLTKFTLCALTLAVLLGVSGCSGDDGKDGAMGAQGVAGQDGADGANGVNGQDGTNGTDGSDGMDGNDGAPGFAAATFILANNGQENAGTVNVINQNAAKLSSFNTGANEGVVFDSLGKPIRAMGQSAQCVRFSAEVMAGCITVTLIE